MKNGYTTNGSVRGQCGHVHRTIETAVRCLKRDGGGCASQGGYTDRIVVAVVNGRIEPLSDSEDEYARELEYPLDY